MKKFLCYDTNDAASGKINVSTNGVLKPNSTVPSTNGASHQQLVTDKDGNTKWEDKLAYDDTKTEFVGTQYSINLDPTSGTVTSQDTIPMELGQTYAVKVARNDGQGTKEYTGLDVMADDDGTLYIGSSDVESGIYPFRITESSTTVVSAFVKGGEYNYITVTCTSDGKIKTIDPKYIPNTNVFFVLSNSSFRTGNDWDAGEDVTIADIATAYHDGGARIFQMSSGECIGISNVIGASGPASSSPFITYYDYNSKTVFTKS